MLDYRRFKILVKKSGFTINELAESIEMTASGMKTAVQNETLKLRDALKICEITGIKLDQLIDVDPALLKGIASEEEANYFARPPRKKYIEQTIEELQKDLIELRREITRIQANQKKD